jgi:hypothetical protein
MAESVVRPIGRFKESPNICCEMNEASLRELGENMLTHGQLQDVIATEDGTVMHVRGLRGQLEGIPSAKSDGV